jgi:hypothetical protein
MATIVVSIICIAMIIVGGMTLSQGILTSADRAALSVEDISIREGELNRTSLENVRAAQLSWGDFLRITVQNTGQTKLANFDKWDVIVHYYDESGTYYTKWLPYTESEPGSNEWQLARIGLNGPTDFFEPGILNPSEEMIILANIDPVSGNATVGDITVSTANGVYDSISFSNPSYTLLTPHSESTIIACTGYYEIAEATPADGPALTFRQDYVRDESGRKLLFNQDDPALGARHVYPLVGISEIPSANWTSYYRCYISGGGAFPRTDGDVSLSIDILIRKADGTVRTIIGTDVAKAYIATGEEGVWLNKNATFPFPGYAVIDENDYLEIDYYVETILGPDNDTGYLQLSVDNDDLGLIDQTRIEDFNAVEHN